MKRTHNVYLLFSMLLLLLFAIGSFALLSNEIFAYRHMQETMNQQDACTLPLSYVHTKLKQVGTIKDVELKQAPFPCLILHDKTTTTYLYYRDGYLMELIAVASYKPTFEEGTKVFPLDNFTMKKTGSFLTFYAENEGKKENLTIYLYGKEGRS